MKGFALSDRRDLPAFSLAAMDGTTHTFPGDGTRPALVAFVKEDCPTCNLVMPVLEALYKRHGDAVDFFVAGQTVDGNNILIDTHQLTVPLLDDSAQDVL